MCVSRGMCQYHVLRVSTYSPVVTGPADGVSQQINSFPRSSVHFHTVLFVCLCCGFSFLFFYKSTGFSMSVLSLLVSSVRILRIYGE